MLNMSQHQLPVHQVSFPSPIPAVHYVPTAQVAANSFLCTSPYQPTPILWHTYPHQPTSTRTSTPTSEILNSAASRGLTAEPNNGIPVPPAQQVATNSFCAPAPTSQLLFSGTPTPTISQNLTRTSTPTSEVLNSAASRGLTAESCNADVQVEEDADVEDLLSEFENEDSLIPSWFNLDMSEIYNHLNPSTKKGQQDQCVWQKSAININGKPITSIDIIANPLLKILTGKKFLPDTPINSILQSKKLRGSSSCKTL